MTQPIDRVLAKLNMGTTQLAEHLGLDVSTAYRWHYPKERGGTDGIIPLTYWARIREMSGGKVKQADFLPEE